MTTLLLLMGLVLFDWDNNRTVYVREGETITVKLSAPADNLGWEPVRLNPGTLQYLGTATENVRPGVIYQVFLVSRRRSRLDLIGLPIQGPQSQLQPAPKSVSHLCSCNPLGKEGFG